MIWTSLVAQMVKNLPTMWETWVQSLDRKDRLEKGMATHSIMLAWKIQYAPVCSPWNCSPPEQRRLEGYNPWGHRIKHD